MTSCKRIQRISFQTFVTLTNCPVLLGARLPTLPNVQSLPPHPFASYQSDSRTHMESPRRGFRPLGNPRRIAFARSRLLSECSHRDGSTGTTAPCSKSALPSEDLAIANKPPEWNSDLSKVFPLYFSEWLGGGGGGGEEDHHWCHWSHWR